MSDQSPNFPKPAEASHEMPAPESPATNPLHVLQAGGAPPPRRFYIETWGCQMNELDTQRMAGQLMAEGVLPTREPGEADIILLNSCSVREKAEMKAYSRLGEYRRLKSENNNLLIGFCGCVAQQEGEKALKRVPDLDFVLGPARVGELRQVVERTRAGERVVATGFPDKRDFDIDAVSRDGSYKGMVTLIEGCNKRCTFCIVPSTRGPERCRPFEEILTEVRHLVSYGFNEIELLGQTVNHWRDPQLDLDFADVLDAVARIDGVHRLRFVTSYPRDFTPRMVEQLGRHENICPYLHLPVQSGSNSVLRRMGRGYTREEYLDLIDQIKRARPGIALSSDMIVGFPGETDEDFEQTLDLVRQVRFSTLFAFKYSVRPGTAAPRLEDHVAPEVANQRLQELFRVQEGIGHELNSRLVGEERDVVVTGWSKQPGGTMMGRTTCHRIVHFPVAHLASDAQPDFGSVTRVRIAAANKHSLMAELTSMPASRPAPRLPIIS